MVDLRFAENESDARLIVRMAQAVVNGGKVEVHLAGVLWLERRHLQVDDDEAPELQVVKEKIESEIFSSDFERHLAADECEADAKLDEELAQVFEKSPFEVALLGVVGESQKIEAVRVFDELLGEVGLWRWKCRLEVCQGFPLAPAETALDLDDEHIPAPAVHDRLLDVPLPFFGVFDEVQKPDVMAPGNLCNSLLHNCFVGPSLG